MSQSAALMVVATGETRALDGEPLEVGRGREVGLRVDDPTCSRKAFAVSRVPTGWQLRNLSQGQVTRVNGQEVPGTRLLVSGDKIQVGRAELLFMVQGSTPAVASAPPNSLGGPTLSADLMVETTHAGPLQGEHTLGARTRIGRDEGLDLRLPHPHVSRAHAEVWVDRNGVNLRDLGSANGTWLNGVRLRRPALLQPGDQLGIGPWRLLFTGRTLRYRTAEGNLTLVAKHLSRRVKDDAGRELLILDDVSLVIEPNELVALLGPSGSGKSTLMGALSGRAAPTTGQVLVNGDDLHRQFEALKRNLALVPQKDVVHAALTVGDALAYTARLRLPPDTAPHEIERVVADTLKSLGLSERKDTRISALSGGQVKRVSLANELLARPSLLFLDEVTSGLDEQTDREMMQCFRKVADSGKTVVCITHSLTNVDRVCDLVVFLTRGGKLAFVGRPAEALEYFDVERLGDVYDALETRTAEEWQRRFRESPLHQTWVTARLAAQPEPGRKDEVAPRRPFGLRAREGLRQLGILCGRQTRLLLADRAALAFAGGQAALVAAALWLFFGDIARHAGPTKTLESANLLFLLATSAIWMGCNNAAKEVVKERDIFLRERDVNLEPLSYFFSKCAVLGALGLVQVVLLLLVARLGAGLEGAALLQLLALNLAIGTGMAIGLFLSAVSRTTDMAVTLVPMALIPQVIFAGGMGPLEGVAQTLAHVAIPNFWAFEGLKATLPAKVGELIHPATQLLLLGKLKPFWTCALMLGLQGGVAAVGTCVVLYRRR